MFRGYSGLKLPPDKNLTIKNYFRVLKRYETTMEKVSEKLEKLPSRLLGPDDKFIDMEDASDIMKRTKKIKDLYLFDKKIAKNYSSMIINDVINHDAFIAEINPGCGFLTRELLAAGIPKIHAYEKHPGFQSYLLSLIGKYPLRLRIRPYNLLRLGKMEYIGEKTGKDALKDIFNGAKSREFHGAPSMVFIGAIPEINFFQSLQWSILDKYLADYGRVVIYAAILPSMSLVFLDDPEIKYFHKAKNIFQRTFFNYEKLGEVSRKGFFPWAPEENWRQRNKEYFTNDNKYMDIVKIEVKKDFINETFTRRDGIVFFYFLNIHLRKRNTPVIPTFEKWIPGCGPRLIRKDYNIYTVFDELDSAQLLDLFKLFKSWPEYDTCSFTNFVDTIMREKMVD